MLILSILIFLAVFMAATGLYLYLAPSQAQQRLRRMTLEGGGDAGPNGWSDTALRIVGPLARLSLPQGDWDKSPLRLQLLQAGLRRDDARLWYFAAKTVLPVALGLLTLFIAQAQADQTGLRLMLSTAIAALVGVYLPNIVVHLLRRERQQEIFDSFPDAADLILVCVEAGLGLDASLTKVTDEMARKSPTLAEELHLANLELRAGASREMALKNLALRTGVEEVATFAAMLTQADRFGTSLGDSLRVFSDDLRHKREARAEERAAKIPTKLLFPLVVFIFPSVIMVVLGPAIIQIIRNVLPKIGGGG